VAQRLIIRNNQAPGDIIVLSAALRDLEIAHPGKYAPEVWVSRGAEEIYWNNPSIARIHPGQRRADGRGATMYRAQYPLIKTCNQQRKHFILGFIEHMNATLQTKIKLTKFSPHIIMSEVEQKTRPFKDPYWVFLSGGKKDYPTKIWAQSYWQRVIDMTKDRVNWVQCGGGSSNHILHKPKDGIYANMVAKTGCRNFLRLIYHAEGIVCVTTMAMHAAAAFNKPCVVIEGGREPWWWEAYNEETRRLNMKVFDPGWSPPANDDFVPHKFLHTIGKLKCCKQHGCWRKRVVGGGSVCSQTTSIDGQMVPKCKTMISPEMVVAAIDGYINDGLARRPKDVKDIKVPLTAMMTPDEEPQPVEAPPVKPRRKRDAKPPANPGNMHFCIFGEDAPVAMTGPKVHIVNNGESRVALLRCMMAIEEDWIVWIERGAKLHSNWLQLLTEQLTDPVIVGRAHRTRGGDLYPYPAFFAVHKSLLRKSDSFMESFAANAGQFKDAHPLVTLPTEHVTP
jgi:ADP-heptose:LPS heptosyltransferase